jgi:hypothetical protein
MTLLHDLMQRGTAVFPAAPVNNNFQPKPTPIFDLFDDG